jgi:hypothetical protein
MRLLGDFAALQHKYRAANPEAWSPHVFAILRPNRYNDQCDAGAIQLQALFG